MNGYELLGFLDRAGFAALRVLVAGLWQSSILFAAAAAILWALRKRRAYARHAILVGALVVAPLLPLISSAVSKSGAPQKAVRVLPSYGERERYAAPAVRAIRVETTNEVKVAEPAVTAIEAVEGVRSRLRAERPVWRSGDVPILRADAENGGNRNLWLTPVQEFFEVEVDGSWYKWAEPIQLDMPVPSFSPGGEIVGMAICLDNRWGVKGTDKRLDLTLGEHVIRVALTCRPRAPDTGGLVRVLSNPVEITILSGQEGIVR